MNKALKITLITLASLIGFVLLVLLLATLLAGPIAKSYVNKHGEELIGRKTEVEHVNINLYSGHVAINGLKVYEDDAQNVFAGWDTLDIGIRLMSLIHKEVNIVHITLDGLQAQVLQDADGFNFNSLIEHFKKDNDTVEKDTTPSDWMLNFHNIRISNGNLKYADLVRQSQWNLKDFSLTVPDFCIGGEDATKGGLSLALSEGGTLKADLDYNSHNNDFKVDLQLDDVAVAQAKPYLVDVVNLGEVDGTLDAHIDVVGNLSKIKEIDIRGNIALDGLDVHDGKSHEIAKFSHLGVNVNRINLQQNLFDIASVELSGLEARYDNYGEGKNNFSDLMAKNKKEVKKEDVKSDKTDSEKEPAAKKESKKEMQLTVGRLDIKEAHLAYGDHTLPDAFNFPISHLNIHADNLHLKGENNAKLYAQLPQGGTAMVMWKGNISNWKQSQDLFLNIKNLHLTDLSPYLVAYLGRPFSDGTFSFTSRNSIKNSNLDGKNHLDIYKIDVGEKRADVEAKVKGIPLKAALYILKDKDDNIKLDVPISGNIDKPEFNYMKLVWKTLGNLIVKVATSPLRALGEAMGVNGANMEFIQFDPSAFDFSSEEYYQMDELAKIAMKDPMVQITMEQQMIPTLEDAFIERAEMRNELVRRHMKQIGVPDGQLTVKTAPDGEYKRNGYAISATIKEEE